MQVQEQPVRLPEENGGARGRGRGRDLQAVRVPGAIDSAVSSLSLGATSVVQVPSSIGDAGNPVKLLTNYFEVQISCNRPIYQYHVDFNPEVDAINVRRQLLYQHKEMLCDPLVFDGMALWMPIKLHNEVTEIVSTKRSDGQIVHISIKFTNEIVPNDKVMMQLHNNQLRRNLRDHLHLKLIQRNYFDSSRPVEIPQYLIELWPGYVTSVRQHDFATLMCVETTFKVVRRESVLDVMMSALHKDGNNFKDIVMQKVLGSIIITK